MTTGADAASSPRAGRRAILGMLAAAPALLAARRGPGVLRNASTADPADPGVARSASANRGVHAGRFVRIYDPSAEAPHPWYINDHCFVRGYDGTWHLFGITHREPADPSDEHEFAHATAPHPLGPWTKQQPALTVHPDYYGETHLWAPHVVWHGGLYWMFYCGGGVDHTQYAMSAAVSPDLWTWWRLPSGPLFRDGYDARDPMLRRIGDRWVLYYTATSEPAGGHHVVAARTSADLVRWSDRRVVYSDPERGTFGGGTESPFVLPHDGTWYLFIGPRGGYVGTDVFASSDPSTFVPADWIGHVPAHAAEILHHDDQWWVSSAGWGQGGVHLAPLWWT